MTQAQAEAAIKGLADRAEYVIEPVALPGTPANGWAVGLAIKSGQPALSKALTEAMKGLQEEGRLTAIWREHGLTWLAP